jgi:hypothetical protein
VSQQNRNDAHVQKAMKDLFLGIAPEHSDDLETLWNTLQLQFCLFEDSGQVLMEAGAYRYVHFNHRALRVFWVSAFAAWEAYALSAAAVIEGKVRNLDRLKELIYIALRVRDASDPESVPLAGLPDPGCLPDKEAEPEHRAAAELAIFAAGWAMLHEVKHLKHQQEDTSAGPDATPDLARKEELSCDDFATDFLMRDVERYANESGYDLLQVRQKRSLGIYFAMFGLVVLSHSKWEETESHPSVQCRLNAVRRSLAGDQFDDAFCIALLAFSSLHALWPLAPKLVE